MNTGLPIRAMTRGLAAAPFFSLRAWALLHAWLRVHCSALRGPRGFHLWRRSGEDFTRCPPICLYVIWMTCERWRQTDELFR